MKNQLRRPISVLYKPYDNFDSFVSIQSIVLALCNTLNGHFLVMVVKFCQNLIRLLTKALGFLLLLQSFWHCLFIIFQKASFCGIDIRYVAFAYK